MEINMKLNHSKHLNKLTTHIHQIETKKGSFERIEEVRRIKFLLL